MQLWSCNDRPCRLRSQTVQAYRVKHRPYRLMRLLKQLSNSTWCSGSCSHTHKSIFAKQRSENVQASHCSVNFPSIHCKLPSVRASPVCESRAIKEALQTQKFSCWPAAAASKMQIVSTMPSLPPTSHQMRGVTRRTQCHQKENDWTSNSAAHQQKCKNHHLLSKKIICCEVISLSLIPRSDLHFWV